ncbi:hypothetical protein [Myroides pelagicus]|uniref:Uncharacterized protein n=1 Tax=Myroides pelagicus TaxID=270914 RepID=A0A7K1GR00_9FLAO|nr:hypothetical protein [Myroides pelagicus]MEC4115037.1 hypothetical protein [Myroides pelagicus]MTH30733.1 hypothetical protein [Myroides pelagicus]
MSYKITDVTDYFFKGDFDTTDGVIDGKEFKVTFKGDHKFVVSNSTSGASKSTMNQLRPIHELTKVIELSNIVNKF